MNISKLRELSRAIDEFKLEAFERTRPGSGPSNLFAGITKRSGERVHGGINGLWISLPLDQSDISVVINGREERHLVSSNDVSIVAPWQPLQFRLENPGCALDVVITTNLLREVAGELFDGHSDMEFVSAFGSYSPSVKSLLHVVMETLLEPARHSTLRTEYLARALVTDLIENYAVQRPRPLVMDTGSRLGSRQLQRVLEYVEGHLDADISLNELAAIAGLSRTAFVQRFKRSLNQTPYRYLTEARVRRGQTLLAKSDLPIVHIAHICGFADHAHFSSVFKRLLGTTPSAYRQMAI